MGNKETIFAVGKHVRAQLIINVLPIVKKLFADTES
jgi:hypothetical protein